MARVRGAIKDALADRRFTSGDEDSLKRQASALGVEFTLGPTAVDYHGPTARLRIMKGVYWRVASIAPQRATETNVVEVAHGTLYVTNTRVILDGQSGNRSVTWRSVFVLEVFGDAIKLDRSSGRDPYLFIAPDQIEMASTIIAGALAAS